MSRHWKISTGRHFQNGRHNTAKIQHCPISTPFHMWVDYDVPNWFLTLKIFYRSPFSKWQYRTNSTLSYFNDMSYVGRLRCGQKKNICVFTVACQKNLGSVGRSGLIFFFFLSTKPEIVVSGIRFRYLIKKNSGKMTNYAVFLPSLLSISTKR
jgi:hypothetical protein